MEKVGKSNTILEKKEEVVDCSSNEREKMKEFETVQGETAGVGFLLYAP